MDPNCRAALSGGSIEPCCCGSSYIEDSIVISTNGFNVKKTTIITLFIPKFVYTKSELYNYSYSSFYKPLNNIRLLI